MNCDFFDITIRLLTAMALGGIIGLERDYRAKDAGFRTHFLVAVGSALFTLISIYGFADGVKDTSRVAAQVVSGIGFLGAGLIVFQKNVIRGLTTAAGLWVTAAIGMACGTGLFFMAVITTAIMLLGLEVISQFVPHLGGLTNVQVAFTSTTREDTDRAVKAVKELVEDVVSYEMKNKHTSHDNFYEVQMEVKMKRREHKDRLLDYLRDFDDVTIVAIE